MTELATQTVYFARSGRANTDRVLDLALARARELQLAKVLVASSTGSTGVQVSQTFQGMEVIVVTHSAGFTTPDHQELSPENRAQIVSAGARMSVAYPPTAAIAARTSGAWASAARGNAAQTRPPAQS